MRKRLGQRGEDGNAIGGAIARVASVGTRALGYFLWFALRLMYRGEPRIAAAFACVGAAMGVTLWVVVT